MSGTIAKPVSAARLRSALESLPEPVGSRPAPTSVELADPGLDVDEEGGPSGPNLRGFACRVLVVDDNSIYRKVTMRRLAMVGVSVEEASGGEEAVDLCARESFDLVLMDTSMPGLDGFQAAGAIRDLEAGRGTRLPIVALTASLTSEGADRCRAAGMDDYLLKPVRSEDLVRVIRRWVSTGGEDTVDPAGTPGPLDLSRLEEISGGDEGFEQELMDEFLSNVPKLVDQAGRAAQDGDSPAGLRAAHTLKGSAAMVGAVPLATAARELEEAFARGDREATSTLAREVSRRLDELQGFVTRHFRERAA